MSQSTITDTASSKPCCVWQIAARALALGTNIILDFGFWAKEERDDYRAKAHKLGAHSEIIFMDVGAEELLERVRLRNKNLTNTIHYIPEEMMLAWIQFFQQPDNNELQPREKTNDDHPP